MADRSISFDLRAVDKASEVLDKAAREVRKLGEEIDRTSGSIEVDAKVEKAQQKLRDVDAQLARLNAKSLKVDADTGTAERQLQILQAELTKATGDRRVKVEADIAGVQAQLKTLAAQKVAIDVETGAAQARVLVLRRELDSIRGKRETVDVDVSGALANLARLAGALAAVGAGSAILVGGLGAAAGAGAALGAGLGAGIAGTMGLGDAVKALGEKSTSAGGAAKTSGAEIRSATQGVVDARRDLARANEDVTLAEADLTRAQDDAKRAQDALNDARKAASRELEDYQTRAEGMALSQRSADLSVTEAQERLAEVQKDAKATGTERARAELNVAEALQRQKDLTIDASRLAEDKTAADAKGVEQSDRVVSAQDRIAQAQQRVQDAQRALARSHEQVTRATERVTEAMLRLQEAQQPKGGGGGGVDKVAEAMDKLGPKAQAFAKYLRGLIDGPLTDLRKAGQEEFLPGIERGLRAVEPQLKAITPAWAEFSGTVGDGIGTLIELGGKLAPSMLDLASASMEGLSPLGGELRQLEADLQATFTRMTESGDAKAAMGAVADVIGEVIDIIPPLVEGGAQVMAALGPGLTAVVRELGDGLTEAVPSMVAMAEKTSALLEAVAPVAPELAALGAAFFVFKKMGGEVGPVIDLARAALDKLRGSARDAGTEVEATGRRAGESSGKWAQHADAVSKAGAALALLQAGDAVFGGDYSVSVSKATDQLLEWTRTGKEASGVTENLESDLTSLQGGFTGAQIKVQAFLEFFGAGFLEGGESLRASTERIQSMDAALASLVAGGKAEQAAAAWRKLTEQAGQQGLSIDRLKEAFPQYAQALDRAKNSADGATSAIDKLTEAGRRSAADFMTTEQSALRYQESLARLTSTVETNGNTLNIHTEKGRANRQALLDLVSAANDEINAMERSGAPISSVTATHEAQRQKLIEVAAQLMGSKAKAQEYIDKLLQVPKQVSTDIKADTTDALAKIARVRAELTQLHGSLFISPTVGGPGQGAGVYRSSGGWVPGAPSQIDNVPLMAAGGEYVVRSSAAAEWGQVLEAINSGQSSGQISALIPAAARASVAGGGGVAGGAPGTVVQLIVQVQGFVAGGEAEFAQFLVRSVRTAVDRGELPAGFANAFAA